MRKFYRNNKDKLISGMLSGSLLVGDLIIGVLASSGLSEPVFPETGAYSHVFVFPTVMFAISGFLGLILSVYRDVMKWLLNIHAAFLVMTILIAMTSFMAISNNVNTFDLDNCFFNGTVCDCRDGTPMDVDCDTLSHLHVFVFIVIVTFLGCVLLCLVETVWDAKRMCCGDEIEDIPGVLDYDGDNVPGQHVSTVPGVLKITTEDQTTSGGHNYLKNIETGVI
uniref:Uncharacterized protein n=1 Tax=Magallana gigas TaxID=29159 RepID=A0A8W8JQP8_MAGGI|nr:uncharacterized protein LOC105335357 isoform X2 [Crassostrea gigas]